MGKPVNVVISLGSNCGLRKENVEAATRFLGTVLTEMRASSIYETPEIHGLPHLYMNAVLEGNFSGEFDELHEMCKIYEKENGRDENARNRGDVPIDLDIVTWDEEIIRPRDFSMEFFKIGYRQLIGDWGLRIED